MKYRLIINNRIEEIEKLEPFVERVSENFTIAPDTLFQLHLALDEALSNSVIYAYPKGTDGTIVLEAQKEDREIVFRLSDEGIAFDPTERGNDVDIMAPVEERPIGGLGIFLIKRLMDEVTYERKEGHNFLTMKKRL